jgi:hypothetical protein
MLQYSYREQLDKSEIVYKDDDYESSWSSSNSDEEEELSNPDQEEIIQRISNIKLDQLQPMGRENKGKVTKVNVTNKQFINHQSIPQVPTETLVKNGLFEKKKLETLTPNDLDYYLGDQTEEIIEKAIYLDISNMHKEEFKNFIKSNIETGNNM